MSQSVRLSDELVNRAKVQSAKFHRSAAQQIEHWPALGQLMEPALSFPVQEKALETLTREFDDALAEVDSPETIARTQAYIREHTGKIIARDA
ncbi:TA system antitoxin ParD family protein [Cerasicoccus frondis]|uniref:TA system antitoxin ParD family protein n=1 Tax=Cerasicoccus frondis TaxID=490090 RepID=UPI0028527BF7|nr:hypothetical protein [Cerasicoccus frondis]